MFHVPNNYRVRTNHVLATQNNAGNNGFFMLKIEDAIAYVIASDGMGWDHVSVHMVEDGKVETPTWEEMCVVKDLFWDEEDCVVQYHPPKSEYVNCHPHTLHLWRPNNDLKITTPPSILVGPKT